MLIRIAALLASFLSIQTFTALFLSALLLSTWFLATPILAASTTPPPPTTAPVATTALPDAISRVARASRIPQDDFSLWVQPIGSSKPLVGHNVDTPRNPASTMKLVTTFAALTDLGPTYTWKTRIHVPGGIASGGTVKDVWIRGGGDPYLVLEEYWKMLSALRDKGVRRIDGDLVIDTSAFALAPEDPGAFDGQPDRVYNLAPHPLLVNFNSVRFVVSAQADGKVGTAAFPALPNLSLINRLKPSPGRCVGYQYGVAFDLQDPTHRNKAQFDGTFPLKCWQFEFARTALTPEAYAHGLFELYWQALGGESRGRMRTGVLPSQSKRALVEHTSRSLGEIIRLVNKFSNNVMTRHVELALGAERFGLPATIDKGHRAITEVLNESGIKTEGLVIANSAGLSRDSRISARQLAKILDVAWKSPFMPEYISSLALVGMDGTMRSRLNGTSGAGRMHVKTGRLDHVSAIAGYVDAKSGQRLLVVLLLNTRNAHLGPGNLLQNAVLTWVHDQH